MALLSRVSYKAVEEHPNDPKILSGFQYLVPGFHFVGVGQGNTQGLN